MVNAGYGFQGSFRRLKDYRFVSNTFAGSLPQSSDKSFPSAWGNRFEGTIFGALPVPLPEDFVLGIDVQRRDFEHPLPSYINGSWSKHGWWWFYIYAMALKEPIPWLCLFAWATMRFVAAFGSRRGDGRMVWLESLGLILFAVVSAQIGFSHHLRYVLPAYPFLFLFMSRVAGENFGMQPGQSLQDAGRNGGRERIRWQSPTRWVLIAWLAKVAIASSPNCLSYFNPICGGSPMGHRYLLYSNVDWGQGLLQLDQWIQDHPDCLPLHICYMGTVAPETLGIHAPSVPSFHENYHAPDVPAKRPSVPTPGCYAISATMLHSPYDDTYRYLLKYKPIASIGGSILIYRFR